MVSSGSFPNREKNLEKMIESLESLKQIDSGSTAGVIEGYSGVFGGVIGAALGCLLCGTISALSSGGLIPILFGAGLATGVSAAFISKFACKQILAAKIKDEKAKLAALAK